jgi:heptaprenyl diphosphate synthase
MDGLKMPEGAARLAPYVILGTALGAFESAILPPILPFRLGLANLATLLAVIHVGGCAGIQVAAIRSVCVAAAFGGLFSVSTLFSLCGGIAAAIVMSVAARFPVSMPTISAVGGWTSGAIQVAIFVIVSGMSIDDAVPLIPIFTTWGAVSGALVGWIGMRAPRARATEWKASIAPSG